MMSDKTALRRTAAMVLAASFLAPIRLMTKADAADGKVTVQWFGQSAFKITSVTDGLWWAIRN